MGYKQGKGKKAHARNEAGVGVGPGRLCQIAPVGPEKQGGEVPCASLRKGGRSERVRKKGAGEDVFKLGLVAVVRQDASGKAVVVGQGKGVCHIVEQHPQAKGVPRGMHAPPAQAGRQAGDGRQRAGKVVSAGKALDPRSQFYYARELWYHSRFEEAAAVLTALLDSGKGWLENQIEACRLLSQCMTALGRNGDALSSLLRSLTLDTPRAEVCCDIGGWFLAREQWRQAAFWYELALTRKRDDTSGAFLSPDCYGYLPAIRLCACWYYLGDVEQSKAFNELAASFRPEDPFVRQNRTFFSSLSLS